MDERENEVIFPGELPRLLKPVESDSSAHSADELLLTRLFADPKWI